MHPQYDQPLADYVRYFGDKTPEHIAYVDGDHSCTYGALDQRASQVANGLSAMGLQSGDRVGFLGVNSGPYVEVFFGSCKAKTVYVGLNWRLTARELEFIINDSAISAIFCDAQFKQMLDKLKPSLPSLKQVIAVDDGSYGDWRDTQSRVDPMRSHDPQDLVLQFYTSGTTGKPKGVTLTNFSMGEHRRSEDQWGDWYLNTRGLDAGKQEVIINAMPNFHVGGLGWLLIGLFRGAKVILMAAPDPDAFLDLVEAQQVTHLFAVPVVLGMMLASQKQKPRDISSLKVFHYGASPIAPSMLKEALEVMGCGFTQYYGMTETNGTVTVLKPSDHQLDNPQRLKSCGRAIDGVEIKICDGEGKSLPAGEAGEIWVKAPAIMSGYWNLPEATAEVLTDGWYRSGDGGRMDADGYLFMADRIKDMIVSGGENVYPSEVENALDEHEAVAEVAVVGVPDEKWGETVKAVIVQAENAEVTAEALIEFLRERLAGYKIPRQYQFVEALPRTPSGKVKKFELRSK
ncbi:long-chain-fatty-acid--CoA ligase [Pseudomaricurvus alkylphenolicus]|jgi:acyl-CoA synthetase (AMP-forming)/AMP-acid ligase II|uniref:long-chain-fatty-acid--CoA ligase n=1 Tax=Pseudomaricurvus alkylphenolicus TaxID=1306991 RepID=UPI001423CB6B|nr:long-chain-fatty-acid--CoA ligase [Pseudomaricurvus alkylphenolicus]NIB38871.1 long-chain-fatty-acid--CoA ligase [Pseudomaricurvus alkylphenolicus]